MVPKGWFWRMFPCTKNWTNSTFGCSSVPKTGTMGIFGCSLVQNPRTRAYSPKPPFYETALLFTLKSSHMIQMNYLLGGRKAHQHKQFVLVRVRLTPNNRLVERKYSLCSPRKPRNTSFLFWLMAVPTSTAIASSLCVES